MIDYGIGIKLDHKIPEQAIDWRNDRKVFDTCRQFTLITQSDHERWMDSLSWNDSKNKMFSIVD